MQLIWNRCTSSTYTNLFVESVPPSCHNGTDSKYYEDPVLPLVDLINSSLMKYDYDTSWHGLLIIKRSSISILKNNIGDDFEEIYAVFATHFFSIGKLAIYKDDEKCVATVISWFSDIENILISSHIDRFIPIPNPIYAIGKLGEIAAEQNNREMLVTAIGYIKHKIEISFENNMISLQKNITSSLGKIGEKCVEYRVSDISYHVLDPLLKIIITAFKEKSNEELMETTEYKDEYSDFSEESKEIFRKQKLRSPKSSDDLVMLALNAIIRMGEIAYNQKMEGDLFTINLYLMAISGEAKKIERKDVSEKADMFVNHH